MAAEFLDAKSRARPFIVFIVPVGPVGQFELFAQRCNVMQMSLRDLVLINMDEYLTDDAQDKQAEQNPEPARMPRIRAGLGHGNFDRAHNRSANIVL